MSTLFDVAPHMAGKNCSVEVLHIFEVFPHMSKFCTRNQLFPMGIFELFCGYLDPVFKADQCPQYVDGIGKAAHTTQQFIKNLSAVFQCLREFGLQHSMAKCNFKVQEADLFGRTLTTKEIAKQKRKSPKSWKKQVITIRKSTSVLHWISL